MHYLSYLKVIQSSPVEKETGLLHEYARIIEETEGRQRIELRNDLNLSEFIEYSGLHQNESSRDAAGRIWQHSLELVFNMFCMF